MPALQAQEPEFDSQKSRKNKKSRLGGACLNSQLQPDGRQRDKQIPKSSLASCPSLLGEVPGHWKTLYQTKGVKHPKNYTQGCRLTFTHMCAHLHRHPALPRWVQVQNTIPTPQARSWTHCLQLITSELVTVQIWDVSQGWTGVSHRAALGSSRPWDFGCIKSPRQMCCLHSSSHSGLHSEDTWDGNLATHSLHSVALIAIRWELRFLY